MVLQLNKNLRYMALSIVALLTIVSCKKETLSLDFELSKTDVELVSAVSENSFTITTEAKWSAESSESWCELSPLSGEGSSVVKVKATSANTQTEDRKAVITVTVGGVKKTINVVQKGYALIKVSTSAVELSYDTEKTSVDVDASEGWSIVGSSLPSWITADKSSATESGKTTVTFTLQNNNTDQIRSANIIFKITNKSDSATFNIKQYTVRGNGRMSDSLALVAILKNIDQPAHQKNFDFTKPIDKWKGVTLTRFGLEYRVTGLSLVTLSTYTIPGTGSDMIPDDRESRWKANTPLPADIGYLEELTNLACGTIDYDGIPNVHVGISGKLPETMGQLKKLKVLSLQNNNFEGSLPSSMRNLTSLVQMQIYNNKFSGELPSFIGEFSNLRLLDCSYNKFSPIPDAFTKLQALTSLNVSYQGEPVVQGDETIYNSASTFQFPSSLLQLKKLDTLYMVDCGLKGSLPASIGNMTGLTELKAYNNELSGNIPVSLGDIPKLGILNLSNNALDGSIPVELGKCQLLRGLFLGNNKLTGVIPGELGKCQFLQVVEVYDNNLSGEITPEFLRGSSLYQLNVSGNAITGTIPKEIANHKILRLLAFSSNQITGISDDINKLSSLEYLLAADNLLTTFPVKLEMMIKILDLDFSGNNIGGQIPTSIGDLFKLESLAINGNQLSGAIPENLLNHRYKNKFNWAEKICPQQAGFGLTNCPSTSNRSRGVSSSRR